MTETPIYSVFGGGRQGPVPFLHRRGGNRCPSRPSPTGRGGRTGVRVCRGMPHSGPLSKNLYWGVKTPGNPKKPRTQSIFDFSRPSSFPFFSLSKREGSRGNSFANHACRGEWASPFYGEKRRTRPEIVSRSARTGANGVKMPFYLRKVSPQNVFAVLGRRRTHVLFRVPDLSKKVVPRRKVFEMSCTGTKGVKIVF